MTLGPAVTFSLGWVAALLLSLGAACSGGDGGLAGSGNPGGAAASGGAGQTPIGGTPSAGTSTTGGASVAGTSAGGSASGGTGVTGGGGGTASVAGSAAGGAASGGGGGVSSAGSGGVGTSGAGGASSGSPGCGSASPLKSGNFSEMINGTERKYVLDVPASYDKNQKYRLVFVWHPLGGSASQVVSGGYNGLKPLSQGSTIFVAADGLTGMNGEASGPGWWNADNGDMKLVKAILDKLNAGLCIDPQRIFSTGFSFGGMMSYTLGYEFDVFRAIAPCSGDLQVIPHEETYDAPLPIMAFHGDKDDFVTTARGRAARDKYLARNKCGGATMPAAPSPCVEYQGCSAPTFWCEFPGGHNTWSEQPAAIWKFFSQF
ncbi:MAG: Ricin and poly(3-hydroxybutyrate) depolymerase fusion [Myxococcales bacterium]|nr:MAG: Ricin and poly(3-hydroxybutyrate) depolymerase fusion [Myxococcales bacterium]